MELPAPRAGRRGLSRRSLITAAGECAEVSPDEVRRRLHADQGACWLDIERPERADYDLLLDDFGFHPLTVDDVRQQNQRPKLDQFPGYHFVVLFGAELSGDELSFREYHVYVSPGWFITIHDEPAPALEDVRRRVREDASITRGKLVFLQYLVIDAVVTSLFPVLDQLDDTIDGLEDAILGRATPDMLARLTGLKHEVAELRRVLGPQRDVFQRLLSHSLEHTEGDLPLYWRDVYENLVRQYEEVDALRDLLSGVMDVYLSTVSNRLNNTMKQLTVIASVFLPLTFLTGFFGMNFGVLVGNIGSPRALELGISVMLVTLAVQLVLFRRRGWL